MTVQKTIILQSELNQVENGNLFRKMKKKTEQIYSKVYVNSNVNS